MRKLRIGVLDLVAQGPTKALYARMMNVNLAGIMPSVIAAWCEEKGHDVSLICYTGLEDIQKELAGKVDLVFIAAFTETAQLAYALSNFLRNQGSVTALGGPHARCYPADAAKYFDYVLGFTDKTIVADVLSDCSPHRPLGLRMAAEKQPASLPGLRARWKFMEPSLRKSPFLKMIPILGSMGCPYSCEFCIDSLVPYQPMDLDLLSDDLRFARENFKRPVVGWHDPNFGVRFDETMEAIERTIPPDSIDFIAESSLSLLSEPRLKRLKANGFKGLLPGVESWYDMGNKAKTGAAVGMDKVVQVAEQVNLIMKYVPYVQTNFVLGLDTNKGPEPFELTKRFVELAPGAFPGYSLLTAFGQATPLNLGYQRAGRVLPFPFHFLDNHHAMNVRPLNYAWSDFYSLLVGLTEHSFSARSNMRRFMANAGWVPKALNLVRAISSEGRGRPKYYREIARMLTTDKQFRSYFEQETTELPQFFTDRVKADLGWLWEWLPPGALFHNPNMCQ